MADDDAIPAAAGGPPDMPDMPDLGGIFDSLQKVQEARSQVYEGHAGGGAVIVRATGDLAFESVTIDPEVVDPSDVEMLQDMILAAINEANRKVDEAMKGKLGGMLPPGLGGLFG